MSTLRRFVPVTLLTLPALVAALSASRAAAQAPPPDLLLPTAIPLSTADPIATGDVNGDGHVDLIHFFWPYPQQKLLAVALGDGMGGFSEPVHTVMAPGNPLELHAADLNHDGLTDAAYFVVGEANLHVQLSLGDGSFSAPTTLPMAQSGVVSHLEVCDVTDDGHLDLVASQAFTNRFTLYVGVGDGSFVTPPSQILVVQGARLYATGDFDGDGHVDLVTSAGGVTQESNFLFGHGDGTFGQPQSIPIVLSFSLAVADLTGDGRDDVASVGGYTSVISWQGGAFVITPIQVDAELKPVALTAGDIDRDGLADLLVASNPDGFDDIESLHRLELEGGAYKVTASYAVGTNPTDLHLVDVDEDGGVDVLSHGTLVTVLAGQGNGDLEPDYLLAAKARDVAVDDVTGDGFPDVVCIFGAGHPAQLLRGRLGGGLQQPEDIDLGPKPEQLWLLDATGDGQVDLLASGGSTIAMAAGHGDGSFDPPRLTPAPGDIAHAEVAPFGGDDLPDVAVLIDDHGEPGPSIVHFLVNAGGSFVDVGQTPVTPPGGSSSFFRAADVDGDLDTDLLVGWSGGYMRVFINQPTGFEPGFLDQGGPLEIVKDIDLDGHVDLAGHTSTSIQIRHGDGTGDFSAITTVPVSGYIGGGGLSADDLDGDGRLDFVVASLDDVVALLAQPGGGYGAAGSWNIGVQLSSVRTADMNGDGKLDFVLPMYNPGLTVVENGLGPWSKHGHSLAGADGFSRLQGFGPLTPGSPATVRVTNGQPGSQAILIAGMSEILAPFKGGVLVPQPTLMIPLGTLDATGARQVSGIWPATMPHDASYSLQVWRPELGAPSGFGATTAIRGTSP